MRKKFKIERKNLLELALFLIKLNLLSLPLYFLLWINFSFLPLQRFLTKLVSSILLFLNYGASSFDIFLFVKDSKTYTIVIDTDCTAWKSILFFLALVFSTPRKKVKNRVIFSIFGSILISIANAIRIVVCIILLLAQAPSFYLAHDILWREGLILIVLAIWSLFLFKF